MKHSPELTLQEVFELIEQAKNCEICRDTESLRQILSSVWTNIEEKPELETFDPLVKAEILRSCGVFLNFYGHQNRLETYQERGKNLLTEAVEIFEANLEPEKATEAQIMLAFCYWNAGEVLEAETILDFAETGFGDRPEHPVYLRIRLNRLLILFAKEQLAEAIRLIDELKPLMMFCSDWRLQAMFHNQAGIFYTNEKLFGKAVFHLNEAIRCAEKLGNKLFVAINLNNLSFLYKDKGVHQKAFECISRSIDGFREIGHYGYLSHALDTKAQIYFESDRPAEALEIIDEAIIAFEKGEDCRGLCEALWMKMKILLSMDQIRGALLVHGKLIHIAETKIGASFAEKYSEHFSNEIYPIRRLPLNQETDEFKKALIASALVKANGAIIQAARILKLKNHQALSWMLKFKYPTLLFDLGFGRRAERRSKEKSVFLEKKTIREEREISLLDLPNKSLSFDFYLNTEKYEVFYFDKYFMKAYGINEAAAVAVIPVSELQKGLMVLVFEEEKFTLAPVEYDKDFEIYFVVEPDSGQWIPLTKENILGEPVGFCPIRKTDSEFIKFSRLVRV